MTRPSILSPSRLSRVVSIPAVVLLVAGILAGPSVGVALADTPGDPTGLAQADQTDTPIALGGLINNGEVHLSGTVTDPSSEQVSLQVEAKRIGTAFD